MSTSSFVQCRVIPTGLTQKAAEPYYELLRATYNLVADPEDVRGPINVLVPAHMEGIVREAIRFMTATTPEVMMRTVDAGNGMPMVRMTSVGYRAGPAGDH